VRLTLELAEDGSAVQVRLDRYAPSTPADRLADAVYRVLLAALEERDTLGIPTADPGEEMDDADPAAEAAAVPAPVVAEVPTPRPAGDLSDPEAVRREALRLLDEDVPHAEVCERLGISRAQLRIWDFDDLNTRKVTL
jgi:dTDP-4-dehydrorhamnose reductase